MKNIESVLSHCIYAALSVLVGLHISKTRRKTFIAFTSCFEAVVAREVRVVEAGAHANLLRRNSIALKGLTSVVAALRHAVNLRLQ